MKNTSWVGIALLVSILAVTITAPASADELNLAQWSCDITVADFKQTVGNTATGSATCNSPWSSTPTTYPVSTTVTAVDDPACPEVVSGSLAIATAEVGAVTDGFTLTTAPHDYAGTINLTSGPTGAAAFKRTGAILDSCAGSTFGTLTAAFTASDAAGATDNLATNTTGVVNDATPDTTGLTGGHSVTPGIPDASPAAIEDALCTEDDTGISLFCNLRANSDHTASDEWQKPKKDTWYLIDHRHHYTSATAKVTFSQTAYTAKICAKFIYDSNARDVDTPGCVTNNNYLTDKSVSVYYDNTGDTSLTKPLALWTKGIHQASRLNLSAQY
jgi:hypothetical protein